MTSSDERALQEEIKAKLLLSDQDLLAEVGRSIGIGATSTDATRRGKETLNNLKSKLHKEICNNPGVIAAYEVAKEDSVQAVAAIVDAIAGALHGIPPATIAILLYRAGIRKYCGPGWPSHPPTPSAPASPSTT